MGPLDQIFGNRGGGSRIPLVNLALLGLLGYRTLKGNGRLAELFNISRRPAQPGVQAPAPGTTDSPGLGDLLGGASGGLFGGGGLGAAISNGLRDLVSRFQNSGMSHATDSWVARGDNRPISSAELEQALGSETVDDLARNAGIPREQLLRELSEKLPQVVDKLTPEGRLPTDQEVDQLAGGPAARRLN